MLEPGVSSITPLEADVNRLLVAQYTGSSSGVLVLSLALPLVALSN